MGWEEIKTEDYGEASQAEMIGHNYAELRGGVLIETTDKPLEENWQKISVVEYKRYLWQLPDIHGSAFTALGPYGMREETWRISFERDKPAVMAHWHWQTGFDWWLESREKAQR